MKKTLMFMIIINLILCTSCMEKKSPTNIQSNQITLNEIGALGCIHDPQASWEILELKDFDLWVLYIKKDKLESQLKSNDAYTIDFDGKDYLLKSNPFNSNILKLLLPTERKPREPGSLIIKTTDIRENRLIKNDTSLAIENIYITKEENNGTQLNEIGIDTYTDLYTDEDKVNFAYERGQFIRPSHVKSNEENAYTINTYFDARTVATTESATGAFQFLKDVNNYEQYIVMENPNRFRVTGDATQLLAPEGRWRVRQLGNMGPLDGNNVFNIVDDSSHNQFILTINKNTLPATYTGSCFWVTQLKEATVCWFDKTDESNVFETVIAYTDAPSTELILNSRFDAVVYKAPDINLKSPSDGAVINETSVTLTWEATPGQQSNIEKREIEIESYRVFLAAKTENYTTPVEIEAKTYTPISLVYGTEYKWQVEAVQSDGKTTMSSEWTFSTLNWYQATSNYVNYTNVMGHDSFRLEIELNPSPGISSLHFSSLPGPKTTNPNMLNTQGHTIIVDQLRTDPNPNTIEVIAKNAAGNSVGQPLSIDLTPVYGFIPPEGTWTPNDWSHFFNYKTFEETIVVKGSGVRYIRVDDGINSYDFPVDGGVAQIDESFSTFIDTESLWIESLNEAKENIGDTFEVPVHNP